MKSNLVKAVALKTGDEIRIDIDDIAGPEIQVIDPKSVYIDGEKVKGEADWNGQLVYFTKTGVWTLGREENYFAQMRRIQAECSIRATLERLLDDV